jgi:hypothetical protein
MNNHAGIRREYKIAADDPEFSVRLASIDDLRRILAEAKKIGFSAMWSSEDSLLRQVNPQAKAIICPLFSNGGRMAEPESYRCHVWFVGKSDGQRLVSLIDVTAESFHRLPEAADPAQLKKVVRVLMDGLPLAALE